MIKVIIEDGSPQVKRFVAYAHKSAVGTILLRELHSCVCYQSNTRENQRRI